MAGLGACQGTIGDPLADPASSDPRAEPAASAADGGVRAEDPVAPADPGPPPPEPIGMADPKSNDAGGCDVGSSELRRLTKLEYERSVADVFGVSDAASGLAPDELIDGVFASNRSSAVAVVQVRQYLDAAESVAGRVKVLDLVACDRAKEGDEVCAQKFIERVGRRAYRRPLAREEQDAYLNVYRELSELDGHEAGLRAVVQGMLQSPNLLYHVELAPEGSARLTRLPGYALASRLSYFLWSSAPDDALLDAAERGDLDNDTGLLEQARRMFSDARTQRGIESFHSQWLGLIKLDTASRDPQLFPEWNAELVSALRAEAAEFSDYVIRLHAGDLPTLLSATYSFPRGPGLSIRDVDPKPADQPVPLNENEARGLLTQPAFLAAHSHSNQSSPILRGRALRERFLCQPLPDPPPNVAAVAPALSPDLTTRERYAMHRSAGSACNSCHRLIDDLGFALENYDALGRYRSQENGKPIDATGQLVDSDVDAALDGVAVLADRFSQSRQVQDCYAKQWLRYALGRSETDSDRCSLRKIEERFAEAGPIKELLLAIATSDAFVQQRRGN